MIGVPACHKCKRSTRATHFMRVMRSLVVRQGANCPGPERTLRNPEELPRDLLLLILKLAAAEGYLLRYSGPDRSPRAADDEWLFSVSWQDDVVRGGRGSKLMLLAAVLRRSSSRRCCMLFITRFGVSVAISTEKLAPDSFLSRMLRRCGKGGLQR